MSLRQSVKKSLMDYQDARVRRRELLGPDALDTLSDISSATVDAAKEKVKSVAVNLRDKFNEYKDERVKPFIEGIRSRIADIRDNLRESAGAVKDQVREDVEAIKFRTNRSKQSFVEKVRGGIDSFRGKMADNLDKVASVLRGDEKATVLKQAPEEYIDGEIVEPTAKKRRQQAQQAGELFEDLPDNVVRLTSPITRLEAVASSQPDLAEKPTVETSVDEDAKNLDSTEPPIEEVPEETQRKLKDTKNAPKEAKDLTDEDIALFAQYYYANHGAARQAMEVVDAKEEPTFADYAMAAGFTEFIGAFRSKEAPDLSKVDEHPENLDKVQQAVQDIDQMKSAQERLQALEAERLILRNQVAEIADKYQLDPEAIEVGQTEVSVKSMEQQLEKLAPTEETAKEVQEDLKQTFPEQSFQVNVDYKTEEPEWVAEPHKEPAQEVPEQASEEPVQEFPKQTPEEPVFDDAYYASLEIPEIELTADDLSEFRQDDFAMQP